MTPSVPASLRDPDSESDDDPRLPSRVRLRLKVVAESAERNFRHIQARLPEGYWERMQKRLDVLIQSREPVWVRLRELYALVEDATAFNGENVACRRGCSHCCHSAVALAKPEAQMLGSAIKRSPKNPPSRDLSDFDYGYHNPCTFLKGGECSIYEHRPLACRVYFSLDEDALLCELQKGLSIPVPGLDMRPFQMAYVQICGNVRLADIRDYFPRPSGARLTSG